MVSLPTVPSDMEAQSKVGVILQHTDFSTGRVFRITRRAFLRRQQMESQHPKKTVAELIERFIADMDGTNGQQALKPLSASHRYNLRGTQRRLIGLKLAHALTKGDIIADARERRKTVCAATVNQDLVFLGGVLAFAGSAYDDCEDVNTVCLVAAKPLLKKYQLVGKGNRRKRLPTDEEINRLVNFFVEYNARPRVKVNMVPVIMFALISTRRMGEICRMTWGDIDWNYVDENGKAAARYMVRDCKHPTKKKGNDKWFPMLPGMPEIVRMQPRKTDDPLERVFPYVAHTCSYLYWRSKKILGIQGLRFHDNRRSAITYWLKIFKNPQIVKLISGHEKDADVLQTVYDGTDSSLVHQSLAELQSANRLPA